MANPLLFINNITPSLLFSVFSISHINILLIPKAPGTIGSFLISTTSTSGNPLSVTLSGRVRKLYSLISALYLVSIHGVALPSITTEFCSLANF